MQLELKNPEGKVIGMIEFPVEELSQSLNQSLSDFSKSSEAQLKDQVTDILKNKETEVAKLNNQIVEISGQLAEAKEKADSFDKLSGLLKTPEGFVEFAQHFGFQALIPGTKAAEAEDELEEPHIIYDPDEPKDKENWKHLDNLGCWVPKES